MAFKDSRFGSIIGQQHLKHRCVADALRFCLLVLIKSLGCEDVLSELHDICHVILARHPFLLGNGRKFKQLVRHNNRLWSEIVSISAVSSVCEILKVNAVNIHEPLRYV